MKDLINIDGRLYQRINEALYSKYGEPLTKQVEKKYHISGDKNLPDGSNPIYWNNEKFVIVLSGTSEDDILVGMIALPSDENPDRLEFSRYFDPDDIDDACEVFEDIIEDIREHKNWNSYRIASANNLLEA